MNAEKKQDILKHALDVFFTYGFRRVSMGDIAEAAGLSRQGLYLYFKTKEEVFRAAIIQRAESLLDEIQEHIGVKKTTKDKVIYAFEVWTLRSFEHEINSKVAKEITEFTLNFSDDDFDKLRIRFEAILADILQEHFTMQKPSATLPAERTAHLIYSAVRGFKLAAKNARELADMIADLIDALLN